MLFVQPAEGLSQEMALAATHDRRSNAGNRMSKILDDEEEDDDFYKKKTMVASQK